MCKISIICRFEGNPCRVFFAPWTALMALFIAIAPARGFAQGIELPPPAAPVPPPTIPRERDPSLLRKQEKAEQKKSEIKSEDIARENAQETRKEEAAKAEAQKARPLYGFIELSLLQPKAVVSQGRSNYACDPTNHINIYARTLWNTEANAIQPWVGVRVAPFGGYGTQGKLTARFAHTWMGPAFGVGRIAKADDPASDNPTRNGLLWSGGIAVVSRLVAGDESAPPLPDDFNPTPGAYESPGLWSEIRWIHITRGALGLGAMGVIQTGRGKIFYYAGGTISGFY